MRFNIAVAIERKEKKVNDLAVEAAKLLEKFGEDKMDSYEVFYYATPEDFEGKILGKEALVARAFVTPEGDWIDGVWTYGVGKDEKSIQEYDSWVERLRKLLEQYKDCAIFIANCHF